MGFFKKDPYCSGRRRVREKPVSLVQLDLFGENNDERLLYVWSQKKRQEDVKRSFQENVLWSCSMDPPDECS